MTSIFVLLFSNFSNHCLANSLEPFRAANSLAPKALYQWKFLTFDGLPAVSSSGLSVNTQRYDPANANCDILVIVSSYDHQKLCTHNTLQNLRSAATNAETVIGMDTGAWLMAAAGLLKNHSATIHKDLLVTFAETFLKVDVRPERYVMDRARITCGGAMAAFDLVLELIARQHGEALRYDVAGLFLHAENTPSGNFRTGSISSPLVKRALEIMENNLEEPIPIETIAGRLQHSQRDLQRHFKREFGTTPGKVYRHSRLMAVRQMVETTSMQISEIAIRCGFQDASAMTRAYRCEFGVAPSSHRKRHQLPR